MYRNCGFVERFEPYSLRAIPLCGGTLYFVVLCTTLAEQPARASLTSELVDLALLGYLRPARLRLAALRRQQILSSPPKKQKDSRPKGQLMAINAELIILFEPYSRRAIPLCGGTSCFVVLCTTLAEQPARASLTSELVDSALLGYLRRRFATTQR